MMTTISEAFNGVMKGTRRLSLTTIVEITFIVVWSIFENDNREL